MQEAMKDLHRAIKLEGGEDADILAIEVRNTTNTIEPWQWSGRLRDMYERNLDLIVRSNEAETYERSYTLLALNDKISDTIKRLEGKGVTI